MKKIIITAAVCLSLLLSGCSFTGFANIEDSLIPPTLSKNQKEIYDVLEKNVGKNIKLKYPSSGDSRNAIIMQDLDGDGIREAIVFYQSTDIDANPNVLIKVLSRQNDKWEIVSGIDGAGSDIDKVSFGDLGARGNGFFAVGYNLANKSEKKLIVYMYNGTSVVTDKNYKYSIFEVMDIDENGKDEILFISNAPKTNIPQANLLSENGKGGFSVESRAGTNIDVYEYVKLAKGVLEDGSPALYLDGKSDSGLLTTEILAVKKGKLKNLIYNPYDPALSKQTLRESISIEDINGDDIYEIPQSYYIGDSTYAQETLTDWFDLKNGNFEKIMSSYVNGTDGYIFSFPDYWMYKVWATKDEESREVTFTVFTDDQASDQVVLKIKTMKKTDSEKGAPDGYKKIKSNGPLDYYAYIPAEIEGEFAVTLTQIKMNLIITV